VTSPGRLMRRIHNHNSLKQWFVKSLGGNERVEIRVSFSKVLQWASGSAALPAPTVPAVEVSRVRAAVRGPGRGTLPPLLPSFSPPPLIPRQLASGPPAGFPARAHRAPADSGAKAGWPRGPPPILQARCLGARAAPRLTLAMLLR
jgi:hypothetical protein